MSQTPKCWVITGGTNTGVMKHVGEALEGQSKTLIGIATWGIVSNNAKLVKSYKIPLGGKFPYEVKSSLLKKGAYLDHNHTHFLLIHDGSQGKYGVEINFRSMFEKWVMENDSGGKIIVNSSLPSWLALEHFQQVFTTTCNSTIKKGYQGFWFV